MIGYAVLSHSGTRTFAYLLASLLENPSYVAIHVDQKSEITLKKISQLFARDYEKQVELIPSHNCSWGGYSLVDVTIKAIEALLSKPDCSWIVVLSDNHLPVRSISNLQQFLENRRERAFIKYRPVNMQNQDRHEAGRFAHMFWEMPSLGLMRGPRSRRELGQMYIGTQWMCVRADLMREIIREIRIDDTFRLSLIPDEGLFVNIISKLYGIQQVKNISLTYQEFMTGGGPAILTDKHLQLDEEHFFARKFNDLTSPAIIISDAAREFAEIALSNIDSDLQFSLQNKSTQLDIPDQFWQKIIVSAEQYAKRTAMPKISIYRSVNRHFFELRFVFKGSAPIALVLRGSNEQTSFCVVSNTWKTNSTAGVVSRPEDRMAILRYKSDFSGNGYYPITHPEINRLGMINMRADLINCFDDLLEGWLEIYLSAHLGM